MHEEGTGRIKVSPAAIAALVAETVKESYGVVGMSKRNRLDELAGSLQRGSRRGIVVAVGEEGVTVDVFVVVEYGIRITEVAYGVMRRVYFTLTRKAGIPVQAVNVHGQELRVSRDTGSSF
jgi:uncharacterized alkaline shock family protein YloU